MQIEIMRMKAGGTPRYRNVFHAGQVIFREFGVRGLFQGLQATCQRNTPACSIYFGMSVHVCSLGGMLISLSNVYGHQMQCRFRLRGRGPGRYNCPICLDRGLGPSTIPWSSTVITGCYYGFWVNLWDSLQISPDPWPLHGQYLSGVNMNSPILFSVMW